LKLWILSDLHHELQERLALHIPEADVCVLAGDIDRPLAGSVDWAAKEIAPHMPVIMVPGNHEFYGDSVSGGIARGAAAAAEHPNVHLLLGCAIEIGGVRFVGNTLWTDYELYAKEDDPRERDLTIMYALRNAQGLLRDHTAIAIKDEDPGRWWAEDARTAHKVSRAAIDAVLSQPFDGPTVVVTHHGVHPGAIDRQYHGSPLNPAFVSDLSSMIWKRQPRMWIHGHIHNSARYVLGETEIVCNPRGYEDENPEFDPALVLEV